LFTFFPPQNPTQKVPTKVNPSPPFPYWVVRLLVPQIDFGLVPKSRVSLRVFIVSPPLPGWGGTLTPPFWESVLTHPPLGFFPLGSRFFQTRCALCPTVPAPSLHGPLPPVRSTQPLPKCELFSSHPCPWFGREKQPGSKLCGGAFLGKLFLFWSPWGMGEPYCLAIKRFGGFSVNPGVFGGVWFPFFYPFQSSRCCGAVCSPGTRALVKPLRWVFLKPG